jgi:hypothetical protein
MFTQDVEDFGHQEDAAPRSAASATPPQEATAPAPAPAASKKARKTTPRMGIEDLEKLDRAKELVGFEPFKSTPIDSLTDEQLGAALDRAAEILEKDPSHFAANAVRNKEDLLRLEYEARMRRVSADLHTEARANMQRDGAP